MPNILMFTIKSLYIAITYDREISYKLKSLEGELKVDVIYILLCTI